MDGRTQDPVTQFLRDRYGVEYVDQITEPGIVKRLASGGGGSEPSHAWLRQKVSISTDHHHSSVIAVVAHAECAGNPVDRSTQVEQLQTAVERVRSWQPSATVVGLWVEPQAGDWVTHLAVSNNCKNTAGSRWCF
jgi:hypothetical protein